MFKHGISSRFLHHFHRRLCSNHATALLDARIDRWDCVHILSSNEIASNRNNIDVFKERLSISMDTWKLEQRKAIWLPIPRQHASLIPIAVDAGFHFHHTTEDVLMCLYSMETFHSPLHEDHGRIQTQSNLPGPGSHQVGIGAIVYSSCKDKLLVVQEMNGPLKGKGHWKIPTGIITFGEDICDAAIREVREETGLETQFKGIAAIRQAHNVFFHFSDIFLLTVLDVLPIDEQCEDIRERTSKDMSDPIPSPDHYEVDDVTWLSLNDYLKQPLLSKSPLHRGFNKIIQQVQQNQYPLLQPHQLMSHWRNTPQTLYHCEF